MPREQTGCVLLSIVAVSRCSLSSRLRDARSVNYKPIKATKRRDRLPPLRVAIHQTAEDERNRRRGQYRDTSGRAFSLSIPFRPGNGRRAFSRNDKIKGTRRRRQQPSPRQRDFHAAQFIRTLARTHARDPDREKHLSIDLWTEVSRYKSIIRTRWTCHPLFHRGRSQKKAST